MPVRDGVAYVVSEAASGIIMDAGVLQQTCCTASMPRVLLSQSDLPKRPMADTSNTKDTLLPIGFANL